MPFNIVLDSEQSFSISTLNGLAFVDWNFDPSPLILTYVQGSANLPDSDIDTIIKDYLALDTSGDFTYHVRYTIPSSFPGILKGEISDALAANALIGYQLTSSNLEVTNTIEWQGLELLLEGEYTNNIVLSVFRKNADNIYSFVAFRLIQIRLRVLNSQAISVNPTSLFFGHVVGATLPAAQTIGISVNGNFKIRIPDVKFGISGGNLVDQGMVTGTALREYTGSGTQTLNFTIKSYWDDLEVPNYANPVFISNDFNLIFLSPNVTVYEVNEAYINPNQLVFTSIINVSEAETQLLNVVCPGAIVVSGPLWLIILNSTGALENTSVIKPILSNNLSPGTYEDFIKVVANGLEYFIPVTFNVYENIELGVSTSGVNFTNDLDRITRLYNTSDFKINLKLSITYFRYGSLLPQLKVLSYNLALFNNRTEFFIGKTLNNILAELEALEDVQLQNLENLLPLDSFAFFRPYYKPAKVNLEVDFIHANNSALNITESFQDLLFIKGRKPLKVFANTAVLNFYAEPLRVTPNSIALFNYYKTENHEFSIYKNGVLERSIGQAVGNNSMFCYRHKFNTYAPGDVVEIRLYKMMEGALPSDFSSNPNYYVSQTYIVFPEGKQSYHIGWENEYGVLDLMEFTGDIAFNMAYESNIVKNYSSFKEYLRKIDTRRSQNVVINTGPVLQANPKRLDSLLDAKRAWIINGNDDPIALVPETKSLANYDSDQELYDYDLEFQINLNNDYKVNS